MLHSRLALVFVASLALPSRVNSHGRLSRHLIVEDLSMVALVQDGTTTAGPFDEEESDYIDDPDMTLAARAGADGVTTDRSSVLDGIPLELTVNVYGIGDRSATVGTELEGVEVSLWHCDAAGVYSAAQQEGTEGQKWLRGRQLTDASGSATFNTIIPGLYVGRMSHIHIRLRLPGETGYAAISQLYFSDQDVDLYRLIGIYADNLGPVTYSTSDGIYRSVDPQVREMLTLSINGDFQSSVTSEVSLALITDVSTPVAPSPPAASPISAPTAVGSPISSPSAGASPVSPPTTAGSPISTPSAEGDPTTPTDTSSSTSALFWASMLSIVVLALAVFLGST